MIDGKNKARQYQKESGRRYRGDAHVGVLRMCYQHRPKIAGKVSVYRKINITKHFERLVNERPETIACVVELGEALDGTECLKTILLAALELHCCQHLTNTNSGLVQPELAFFHAQTQQPADPVVLISFDIV